MDHLIYYLIIQLVSAKHEVNDIIDKGKIKNNIHT